MNYLSGITSVQSRGRKLNLRGFARPMSSISKGHSVAYAKVVSRNGKLVVYIPRSSFVNVAVPGDSSRKDLESEFHSLVTQWESETSFHSSLSEKFTHEAYQRIMAMGRDALPFIFADLQHNPRHWFYALEKILGRDVAKGTHSFASARAAWLEWGYKNNCI